MHPQAEQGGGNFAEREELEVGSGQFSSCSVCIEVEVDDLKGRQLFQEKVHPRENSYGPMPYNQKYARLQLMWLQPVNLCMESTEWKTCVCILLSPSLSHMRCLTSCTTVPEHTFVSPSSIGYNYWNTMKQTSYEATAVSSFMFSDRMSSELRKTSTKKPSEFKLLFSFASSCATVFK